MVGNPWSAPSAQRGETRRRTRRRGRRRRARREEEEGEEEDAYHGCKKVNELIGIHYSIYARSALASMQDLRCCCCQRCRRAASTQRGCQVRRRTNRAPLGQCPLPRCHCAAQLMTQNSPFMPSSLRAPARI